MYYTDLLWNVTLFHWKNTIWISWELSIRPTLFSTLYYSTNTHLCEITEFPTAHLKISHCTLIDNLLSGVDQRYHTRDPRFRKLPFDWPAAHICISCLYDLDHTVTTAIRLLILNRLGCGFEPRPNAYVEICYIQSVPTKVTRPQAEWGEGKWRYWLDNYPIIFGGNLRTSHFHRPIPGSFLPKINSLLSCSESQDGILVTMIISR